MRRWFGTLAVAIALALLAAAGCGNGANGVASCKQIEEARCAYAAANCQSGDAAIQLTPPYTTNGSAQQACDRYYDTACLNGLANNPPNGNTSVTDCVAAIQKGPCAVAETPWNYPACAWLIPPNTPEASTDADAEGGDASDSSEAGEDGD
jgi:hypothetical protein